VADRREKMNDGAPERSVVAKMVEKMIEKNRAQARELEELVRRVEADEAKARQREAELADRLAESRIELADAHAAMEREKEKRIEAERVAAATRAAIDQARKIFDALPTPFVTSAPTPEPSVDVERSEVESVSPVEAAGEGPAEGGAADPASEVGLVEDRVEVENIRSEKETVVPMTIGLPSEEAAALAERAEEEGFPDGATFAVHLIREALRQAGQPFAEAGAVVAAAGSG
jgi:uncharacterized protein YhaN